MKWDLDELGTVFLLYLKFNAVKRCSLFAAQDTSEVARLLGLLCACRVKQSKDSPQFLFMIGYLLLPALTGIRAKLLASYMVVRATIEPHIQVRVLLTYSYPRRVSHLLQSPL